MQAVTEFLSEINIWLAVVLVDGAIFFIIYALAVAIVNLRYAIAVWRSGQDPDPEELEEEWEDWMDDEKRRDSR